MVFLQPICCNDGCLSVVPQILTTGCFRLIYPLLLIAGCLSSVIPNFWMFRSVLLLTLLFIHYSSPLMLILTSRYFCLSDAAHLWMLSIPFFSPLDVSFLFLISRCFSPCFHRLFISYYSSPLCMVFYVMLLLCSLQFAPPPPLSDVCYPQFHTKGCLFCVIHNIRC